MGTHLHQAIGVDIGGTKLLAAIAEWQMDDNGELVYPNDGNLPVTLINETRVATPITETGFAAALNGLINTLQAKSPQQLPVGISSAGMIQPSTSAILGATGNLPALQGVDSFADLLTGTAPLYALNDANAAAFGEYAVLPPADQQKFTHVLMITLGTGIGGGFVINGQIFNGEHGGAMEVGHICLDPHSRRHCTCGKIGCWEAYASGTGLQSTLMKALADDAHQHPAEGTLSYKAKSNIRVTTYDLMASVNDKTQDDPLADEVIALWHDHLARGLASVVTVLNPGLVILGGGLGTAVDINYLRERLASRVLQPIPEMRVAQLDNAAGLVGAALLADQQRLSSTRAVASSNFVGSAS